METRKKMETTIRTLYEDVFNRGKADLLQSLISGPYIQHNPLFPDGPEPLVGYLGQVGTIPCEIKRMAIEGDLAFVHVRYPDWAGTDTAAVDIFRFDDDGRILEHWDVMQPVSASDANANGMF